MFTVDCFAYALDNIDGLELFETDSEESEKELEDSETVYFRTYGHGNLSGTHLKVQSCQADLFRTKKMNHGEINTPPPELR